MDAMNFALLLDRDEEAAVNIRAAIAPCLEVRAGRGLRSAVR